MPDEKTKNAGVVVHLVEELGDARLRCDQLVAYVAEAVRLIEDSPHKDHFFEVAGHLIHATPVTLQKLQKSLQAVALAANRIDYEELKNDLRPEKVQQLERALENVRIRQIHRRSEPSMITPQYVADKLRQFAATTRDFQLPQAEVAKFILELEGGPRRAAEKVPLADTLERFADTAEAGNRDYSRLAAVLRRMVGDVHVKGTLAALQEEPLETRTAGASEALQFKDLTKKRLPAAIRGGKEVDAWVANVESVLGGYIDLLAHDKWAKEKLFMVSDEAREFKAAATKFRATLATLKKVIEMNYMTLAESVNPDEHKTEPEWARAQKKRAYDAEAWKVGAARSVEASDEAALMDRMVKAAEQQVKEMKSSLAKYKADPDKNKPQLDNFKDAILQVHRVSKMVLRKVFDVKLASGDEDKQSRFEEGKPADPTKNMSPEDAKKWKAETERNKDKFKSAETWKAGATPSKVLPYKRGRSIEELMAALAENQWVEVSEKVMETLSRAVAKKGTNVRARRGKGENWHVSVLDPKKLKTEKKAQTDPEAWKA